jgi:hypothetical protein
MHLPPVAENDLCGGLQFGRAEGLHCSIFAVSRRRLNPRVRRSPEPRVNESNTTVPVSCIWSMSSPSACVAQPLLNIAMLQCNTR